MTILEIQDVTARRAAAVEMSHVLDSFDTGAGPDVNQVDVHPASTEHAIEGIGISVLRDGERLALHQRHLLHEVRCELHEAALVQMPGCE